MSVSSAEGFTTDKWHSTIAVLARNRGSEFDGVLTRVPNPEGFRRLNELLSTTRSAIVEINNALIDMDGPLGPSYEGFSDRDRENLQALKAADINLSILSNNANPFKQGQAAEVGVPIFGSKDHPKPSMLAYEHPLKELGWSAKNTVMFGDTAAMDKPFLGLGSKIRIQDLAALKFLFTGWTAASGTSLLNRPAPVNDHHPCREKELLAANFLVLPQNMNWGKVRLMQETKRRAFKLLINAQAKNVISHHPGLITDEHLAA